MTTARPLELDPSHLRREHLPCKGCKGEINYASPYGMADSFLVYKGQPYHYGCAAEKEGCL